MDWKYTYSIFVAVAVVVGTFWDIAKMLITHVPLSAFSIVILAFCWAIMVVMNPFWKDVWRK